MNDLDRKAAITVLAKYNAALDYMYIAYSVSTTIITSNDFIPRMECTLEDKVINPSGQVAAMKKRNMLTNNGLNLG